jgi:hypothetical protein
MDQNQQIHLYNELLNTYVYFFNQSHPDVSFKKTNLFFIIKYDLD